MMKYRGRLRRGALWMCVLFVCLLLGNAAPLPVKAATFPDKFVTVDNEVELMNALAADEEMGPGGTKTIELSSGFIAEYNENMDTVAAEIPEDVAYTIVLAGGGQTLFPASGQPAFVFTNKGTGVLTIRDMTLNGRNSGKGMVLNAGKYALSGMTLTEFAGSAITLSEASAALDATDCVFQKSGSGIRVGEDVQAGLSSHQTNTNIVGIENCTFQNLSDSALAHISNLTVKDTLFQNNTADCGAAIKTGKYSVTAVRSSTFFKNSGIGTGLHGGAISMESAGSAGSPNRLDVSNCYFYENVAPFPGGGKGGRGGAIGIYQAYVVLEINRCVFEGNRTVTAEENNGGGKDRLDGGAIALVGTAKSEIRFRMANSTFAENRAEDAAAAIFAENTDSTTSMQGVIENCTFAHNTAKAKNNGKGGAVCISGAAAAVQSSTFYKNHSLGESGGAVAVEFPSMYSTSFLNCLFVDNTAGAGQDVLKNVTGLFLVATDNGGNIGLDNAGPSSPQPNATDIFGTAAPELADNGTEITTGCAAVSTTLQTLFIAPNLGAPGAVYADGAGVQGDTDTDQRGFPRGAVPDAGAVDIRTTKFHAQNGRWSISEGEYAFTNPMLYAENETVCLVSGSYAQATATAPAGPDMVPTEKLFAGWTANAAGTGMLYEAGEALPAGGAYYASWQTAVYPVVYHKNDGTAEPHVSGGSFEKGTAVALSNIEAVGAGGTNWGRTEEGYSFLGWAESPHGPPGSATLEMPGRAVDLYAVWQADPETVHHTVTYEPNGGTGKAYTDQVSGEKYVVLKNESEKLGFTKAGAAFAGWSTGAAGGVEYSGGEAIAPAGNIRLYAVWQANPETVSYTVTYEPNGGTGKAYADQVSGEKYVVLKNESEKLGFTKAGAAFAGWSTGAAGGVKYSGGEAIAPAGNIRLYAVWAAEVETRLHYAYILGYPDGTIRPNQKITREEVAAILLRILPEETLKAGWKTQNGFPDVQDSRWSNNAVSTLAGMGVVLGDPGGGFRPADNITRGEFAAVLVRIAGPAGETGTENPFTDVRESGWAANSIKLAYAKGYITGYPDGSFRPNQPITRAEAMAMLNRVLERRAHSPKDLLPGMQTFTDNAIADKWYYLAVQQAANSYRSTVIPGSAGVAAHEKWISLAAAPNWLLLNQRGFAIEDLYYP